MPIKGVSDIRRLPRLGKVRLGIKETSTKTGNPYPKAVDYFVCDDRVKAIYGEKPKELKILFPIDEEPQQWLRCYSFTRGLICKGDGETAMMLVDKETGALANRDSKETELKEVSCDPNDCPSYRDKQCRRVMNLQFLLPEVEGFGVWQLDTSSFYSIVNINSALSLLKNIIGKISMIPLKLKLIEQDVQPEGKKKKVHVLSLETPYSFAEIAQYAQMSPMQVFLPPPEVEEAPEDLFPEEVLNHKTQIPEVTKKVGGVLPPTSPVKQPPKAPSPIKGEDFPKPETIKNLGNLRTAWHKFFKEPWEEALAIIGVESQSQIANASEAWRRILEAKTKRGAE